MDLIKPCRGKIESSNETCARESSEASTISDAKVLKQEKTDNLDGEWLKHLWNYNVMPNQLIALSIQEATDGLS